MKVDMNLRPNGTLPRGGMRAECGSTRSSAARALTVLAALSAVAFGGCVGFGDSRAAADAFAVYEDVAYDEQNDAEILLDIALPTAWSGPFPAVLFLHGGGFKEGGKGNHRGDILLAAQRGYAGFSANYRLTASESDPPPHNRFPAAVHDVKSAIRWIRANAVTYQVDPDRIGVCGFSAGANLALMAALTDQDDGFEGNDAPYAVSSAVQAVVAAAPPVDFTDPNIGSTVYAGRVHPRYLGGSIADVPENYQSASPITYLDRNDPPILAIFGGRDVQIGPTQAERLGLKMIAERSGSMVLLVNEASHSWFALADPLAEFPMWSFLDSHLKAP